MGDPLPQGQDRTDVGREVIEDLGFRQMVWNAKKEAITITSPVLTEVLTSMVTAWDPDYAIVGSNEMVRLVEKSQRERQVGWLTYLSRRLGKLPPLTAPVRIEPVGTSGWLLVLSPEPMTASNPEHVAYTARVRELLDRVGLIQRPQPEPASE